MDQKITLVNLSLLCSFLLFLSSCGNEKDREQTEQQDYKIIGKALNSSESANPVVMTGKTDDTAAFEYLNLVDFSDLGFTFSKDRNIKTLTGDSLHLLLKEIEQPQLMDVIAFTDNQDTVPYYTRIFVSPGDSIFLRVENGRMEFSGRQKAHYNFFLELNDPLRQDWAVYKNDPDQYKQQLETSYNRKNSVLEAYVTRNPEVSEDFINLVSAELKFEYLYHLIMPRNITNFNGDYTNNPNEIKYVNAINNPSGEEIFDSNSYFEGISIEDFNRPELINNDYFRRSLISYIRHYFSNQEYLEYSRKNFLAEKEFIQANLDKELETYAIGKLIDDYHRKGFGQGEKDRQLLQELINDYEEPFSEPSYAQRMNEILDDLQAYNFELPEEVLTEKLLSSTGDIITLQEILARSGEKIKVIDFWATWCGPCISEFKKAPEFRNKIAEEEELDFLYFSIDEERERWKSGLDQLSDLVPKEKQYLIINTQGSPILNHMLIRESPTDTYFGIPRYSILGRDNRILNNNAPRPSDTLSFKSVIQEIKGL